MTETSEDAATDDGCRSLAEALKASLVRRLGYATTDADYVLGKTTTRVSRMPSAFQTNRISFAEEKSRRANLQPIRGSYNCQGRGSQRKKRGA